MRFLEREGDFRRGGPRPNYCDQRQQVTWMRAIFLSRDRLKLTIASGVGCVITRQRFLSKYALASGDNRTFPSWPAPTINSSHPSSKTNFASSFETMWEVPYFSFESRFRGVGAQIGSMRHGRVARVG